MSGTRISRYDTHPQGDTDPNTSQRGPEAARAHDISHTARDLNEASYQASQQLDRVTQTRPRRQRPARMTQQEIMETQQRRNNELARIIEGALQTRTRR